MSKAGRPKKFKSLCELEAKIDAFFEKCDREGEPYSITGLALALNTSRRLLCKYEREPEFSNAIKRAKTRCEHWLEKNALAGRINPTFAIFALKNFGWSDRHSFEHSGGMTASVVVLPDPAKSVQEWQEKARRWQEAQKR